MSHPAFEIENWEKIESTQIENWVKLQAVDANKRPGVLFEALDIEAPAFYFFLKEKFGTPNQNYKKVSRFFPPRHFSTGMEWAYLFRSDAHYLVISGDNNINIFVFSLFESPSEIDFLLFCENTKLLLRNFPLEKYKDLSYDIYVNYSFFLKDIISELIKKVDINTDGKPENMRIASIDIDSKDPEVHLKHIERAFNYNQWLKAILEKSAISLQIRILFPIYLESLIDLAFRVKLKKVFDNKDKTYGKAEYGCYMDIFQYFAKLPFMKKIYMIKEKCGGFSSDKMEEFITEFNENNKRQERNQLLHGNSGFFRNTDSKIYSDGEYLVGLPDRFDVDEMIANSIKVTIKEDSILSTVSSYEDLCDEFIGIFNNDDSFTSIVSSIVFGQSNGQGGLISIAHFNSFKVLYAPLEW
jgi:hypothetical protein